MIIFIEDKSINKYKTINHNIFFVECINYYKQGCNFGICYLTLFQDVFKFDKYIIKCRNKTNYLSQILRIQ